MRISKLQRREQKNKQYCSNFWKQKQKINNKGKTTKQNFSDKNDLKQKSTS